MRKVGKKVCKLSLFSQLSAPIKSGVRTALDNCKPTTVQEHQQASSKQKQVSKQTMTQTYDSDYRLAGTWYQWYQGIRYCTVWYQVSYTAVPGISAGTDVPTSSYPRTQYTSYKIPGIIVVRPEKEYWYITTSTDLHKVKVGFTSKRPVRAFQGGSAACSSLLALVHSPRFLLLQHLCAKNTLYIQLYGMYNCSVADTDTYLVRRS